jgi:hypothetical protein
MSSKQVKLLKISTVEDDGDYKYAALFTYKDSTTCVVKFGDINKKELVAYKGLKNYDSSYLQSMKEVADTNELESQAVLDYYILYHSTSYNTNKKLLKEQFADRFTQKSLIDKEFGKFPKNIKEPEKEVKPRGRPKSITVSKVDAVVSTE